MPLELKDIPEPIGNFILEQKDVKPLMLPDGAYYHYSHVCVMLKKILTSRFASTPPTTEEAELWRELMSTIGFEIKTDRDMAMVNGIIWDRMKTYSLSRRSEQNLEAIEFAEYCKMLPYGFVRGGKWIDSVTKREFATAELYKEFQLFKQKQ